MPSPRDISLLVCVAFCSALQQSAPDLTRNTVAVAAGGMSVQQLPISMASAWPVWVALPDSKTLLRVPAAGDEAEGWVAPLTFEQLWLPEDLPSVTATAAVGLVLKDGMPRYVFPCLEATVVSSETLWHSEPPRFERPLYGKSELQIAP